MASRSLLWAMAITTVAVAVGVLNLETSKHKGRMVEYESNGFFRECIAWDSADNRFLVSGLDGVIGQVTDNKETVLIKDTSYTGNATLGMKVDKERNRVVVAIADILGFKYSAVAAYDLKSLDRLFLTRLSGSDDGAAMADDVAIDDEGNIYVTDAKGNKIWKVSKDGAESAVIEDKAFKDAKSSLPFNMVGLNGIVYHPDGYLLVVHTWSGCIFKVGPLGGSKVRVRAVKMPSSVLMGDGLALLDTKHLVVAASVPSARIVESTDGWESGHVTHRYVGPAHRLATSAAIKDDGTVFVSHLLGWKRHLITEAIFSTVSSAGNIRSTGRILESGAYLTPGLLI